jgi:hypothetical protein
VSKIVGISVQAAGRFGLSRRRRAIPGKGLGFPAHADPVTLHPAEVWRPSLRGPGRWPRSSPSFRSLNGDYRESKPLPTGFRHTSRPPALSSRTCLGVGDRRAFVGQPLLPEIGPFRPDVRAGNVRRLQVLDQHQGQFVGEDFRQRVGLVFIRGVAQGGAEEVGGQGGGGSGGGL